MRTMMRLFVSEQSFRCHRRPDDGRLTRRALFGIASPPAVKVTCQVRTSPDEVSVLTGDDDPVILVPRDVLHERFEDFRTMQGLLRETEEIDGRGRVKFNAKLL